MQIEFASHIATISSHLSLVHHLSFAGSKVRPSFASWVEDTSASACRTDGIRMWFAYVRKLARMNRRFFPRFVWVLREERGKGGRYHMHAITGGWLNPAACSAVWPWGRAEVSAFRPDGNIGDYISKCLGVDIEQRRFSGREENLSVTFSKSAELLINNLIRCNLQNIESGAGSQNG